MQIISAQRYNNIKHRASTHFIQLRGLFASLENVHSKSQ